MLVGPGIARNSRPARTVIVDFSLELSKAMLLGQERAVAISKSVLRGRARQEKHLSPGFATAGLFGLLDRAEPASALADLHLDLRIPAAFGRMIDAFAGAVDIALDGAVGRRRDPSGRRGQQNCVRVRLRLGGSQDRCLLVADAPVPRRDEGAMPHSGLGFARGLFIGVVIM